MSSLIQTINKHFVVIISKIIAIFVTTKDRTMMITAMMIIMINTIMINIEMSISSMIKIVMITSASNRGQALETSDQLNNLDTTSSNTTQRDTAQHNTTNLMQHLEKHYNCCTLYLQTQQCTTIISIYSAALVTLCY